MKYKDLTCNCDETSRREIVKNFVKAIKYHDKEDAEDFIENLCSNLGLESRTTLAFLVQITVLLEK